MSDSPHPSSSHWPISPVPATSEWASRCCARLLLMDPMLDPTEAERLAADMSGRLHWRSMLPEAAADALFKPIDHQAR